MFKLILGIFIPFFGTCIGSFFVFFLKKNISLKFHKILIAFSAGVMIASSVWSLIIPSVNQSEILGLWSFLPVTIGICIGVAFMVILDHFCRNLTAKTEDLTLKNKQKNRLLFWAITIHNVPEGMAVGVALAGAFLGDNTISMASALALAFGISIQNIPEGAIVSLPLRSEICSKKKAFLFGTLSGIVEPISAIVTIFLIKMIIPLLPYLLSIAAGAMIYVSIQELMPEAQSGESPKYATFSFLIGFLIMMILDIVFG